MASSTRQPGQTTNAVHWRRLRAERLEQTNGHCENLPELIRPAPPSLPVARRKDRIAAIIRLIRMATVCERCGDPDKRVEWHHDEHPQYPERRIANLVDDGKPIEAVIAEIDQCEAVCRSCHVRGDCRGDYFRTQTHGKGEGNGRAKLTAAQVGEIRAAYAADSRRGRQVALARQYDISPQTINHVVSGRTWASVNESEPR